MITVLLEGANLDEPSLRISGPTYQHLFRARRLERDVTLRITDGAGRARWAAVTRIGAREATITLADPAPTHESALALTLFVATPRAERAAWLIEKATEIGVVAVRFLRSERAPRFPGAGMQARWRRLAAAALEQSHRATLPLIDGPHDWSELARLGSGIPWRGVLAPAARHDWPQQAPHPGCRSAALLVGPEGGWTVAEQARVAELGWLPIGLGERTLRIETAALAGAALVLLGGSSPPGARLADEDSGDPPGEPGL
jgi:16S rRNA (uracil1498-N3)-methyltransferase